MTCREFVEFLEAYLSRDLGPAEQAEFERHLAACEACRRYLESYRKAVELGKRAFEPSADPVPPQVPESLVRAILKAKKEQKS